jgi:hypothetical protein
MMQYVSCSTQKLSGLSSNKFSTHTQVKILLVQQCYAFDTFNVITKLEQEIFFNSIHQLFMAESMIKAEDGSIKGHIKLPKCTLINLLLSLY